MSLPTTPLLVSNDPGLLRHWQQALQPTLTQSVGSFSALAARAPLWVGQVWLDIQVPDMPIWDSIAWRALVALPRLRIIATSSHPKDASAIAALDAGCAGYCHAYSDAQTLAQVKQVVAAGHIWIGQRLMQQLIQSTNYAASIRPQQAPISWSDALTQREAEVARLAAQGASNLDIAQQCGITERTVKAHLSAVFEKLGVPDRLMLALKVHGIR